MTSTTTGLDGLLAAGGFGEDAEKVDGGMYRLRFGSATVIVGQSGKAVVAIAPLFKELPRGREAEFFRFLLGLNASMGGLAAFAVQTDGWTVLQAARSVSGMDADELSVMVTTVGQFADEFDDKLFEMFFAQPAENDDDDNDDEAESA